MNVLNAMSSMYGVPFTPEQINKFRLANSFGVPIKQMPGFLDLKSDIQDQTLKIMVSRAIAPITSLKNGCVLHEKQIAI